MQGTTCASKKKKKYYEPRGFESFFLLTRIYSKSYSGKDFVKIWQLSFSYFLS